MSQGVENQGSLISVPLALRAVLVRFLDMKHVGSTCGLTELCKGVWNPEPQSPKSSIRIVICRSSYRPQNSRIIKSTRKRH